MKDLVQDQLTADNDQHVNQLFFYKFTQLLSVEWTTNWNVLLPLQIFLSMNPYLSPIQPLSKQTNKVEHAMIVTKMYSLYRKAAV